MKTFNNIRKRLIKWLIRDSDGYTFTGFREGQPIKFYYQEKTGKYFVGMRCGNMYYAAPSIWGWCFQMSEYLDWGNPVLGGEPVEINFQKWMYGILDNVHQQYTEELRRMAGEGE